MPRPFNAAVETKFTGCRILPSDCNRLALLDYRTMLKFMTLRLADSAASQARGGRFKFKNHGTSCGIPYWSFGRRFGLFILSLQHLTSEDWVVSNGRLSLHKGSNVLQPRRLSTLNNLIVFVLPFDDKVIRKTANDTLEVCCDVCFTFNVALKKFLYLFSASQKS